MAAYDGVLHQLNKNLNILQEREAKYGGNAPLALLHQIEDHKQAVRLTDEARTGALTEAEWREALKPLLVEMGERGGEAQVTIGDVGQGIINSTIAGRDVVIYNYHYHGQVEATAPAVEGDDEPIPDNPYRGLFTFRPEHAPFFFGRETFAADLVAVVESRRLTTVLGASGSGKSSVVFAGLVPELDNRPGEPWLFTTFRPGDDPFQNLAAALTPLYEETESKTALLGATRDLAGSLRRQRYPLSDALGLIREAHPDHRLLLIADQFEELYTLCRDTDARRAFLDLLLAAFPSNHSQSKIQNLKSKIVLVLRADFLGQASLYRPLADALQGTTELLGPMTETELRDAIEKPAALQGVRFEEGLVETLLADVGREEGSLPLLEFALSELWRRQEKLAERAADLTEQEQDYIRASLAEQRRQENRRRLLLVGAAAAAVVMAALAIFSIFQWQDARQQRNKAQTELNFLQTTAPIERLEVLDTLFSQNDPDSRAKARHLFFTLPEVDQVALLRADEQPEALATVGRAVLPNLADINGIYYTNRHLTTLQEAVADSGLQADLEGWLAARETGQAGDYEAALARYTDLLETDDQNPAFYHERARMRAKLGQNAEALADLSTVMELVRAPEYQRSGVLPAGSEFANQEQMSRAVKRMIMVYSDLAAAYEANTAAYPTLSEVRLPVVERDEEGVPVVQVPAGRFKMGSNDGDSDEQPVHEVYLDEFYIDRYEVTNARYAEFLNEQGNQTENREEGDVTWYDPEAGLIEEREDGTWQAAPDFERHPVTGVSWYGAKAYCTWRGGDLPTEAQWEKAARGTDERSYPWGEEIASHLARYVDSSERSTAEIGHYPEGISPYGVYDMAGNVWEWVDDTYDEVYYLKSPYKNPTGPEDEHNIGFKVLRGGSWLDYYGFFGSKTYASYRSHDNPDGQPDYGFRCVIAGP